MKICFPIEEDKGKDSIVFDHFGSAKNFVIFDSENKEYKTISNSDKEHEHGQCNPLASFTEDKIEIVIVGGMGSGALTKLLKNGVRVFKAEAGSVEENIKNINNGKLAEFKMKNSCCGHHGGCCGH